MNDEPVRTAHVPDQEPATPQRPSAPSDADAARVLRIAREKPITSSLAWSLGAIGSVALLGIAAYLTGQARHPEALHDNRSSAVPPPSAVQAARPSPPPSPRPLLLPPVAAMSAMPGTPNAPVSTATPIAAAAIMTSTDAIARNEAPNPHRPHLSPPFTAPPTPAASDLAPIRITHSAPVIPQDIHEGYAAFNAGEFDRAHAAYTHALRTDPGNSDALHGLVALARVRGDERQAILLLQRIAELDPADPTALATLDTRADPVAQEARLLSMAASRPESAPIALALGNLYAAQARWREARQAYANAWTWAPGQPDHAYNLAVSLDHLRQPGLALQYYREALSLRALRTAAFDAQAVIARIEWLQAGQSAQ
jgi:tetratricopeptide (TPR) repeat protein